MMGRSMMGERMGRYGPEAALQEDGPAGLKMCGEVAVVVLTWRFRVGGRALAVLSQNTVPASTTFLRVNFFLLYFFFFSPKILLFLRQESYELIWFRCAALLAPLDQTAPHRSQLHDILLILVVLVATDALWRLANGLLTSI